jgi:hypothetical protein
VADVVLADVVRIGERDEAGVRGAREDIVSSRRTKEEYAERTAGQRAAFKSWPTLLLPPGLYGTDNTPFRSNQSCRWSLTLTMLQVF